ncbi:hypothetical protein [Enterococcus faecalis]|uniref:hypothetical protein n=1 Tax=Enterococcus faecalis TaxID=1351 RepID=UPI001E373FF8|nr:hypothetical protein [Enterococcus faecalis]MDV2517684.1 hypothetical protein [Enterococcus faecalis]MDV2542933.1 hypothetical protein [Enterococcus faecalis]MDV2590670.1 hypothetical protein [Enterococcus faecalis]
MNKGSKYKSGQRPTFRIWDNEKNDWFEPTYEGWDGKIEELLLSPTGDLAMRTFTDFKRESIFPERFEIVLDEPQKVRAKLAKHWHEDVGDCLWWDFPVEEPPYCGTPLDEHFPEHKTHFTTIDMPNEIEKPKQWVVNEGDLVIHKGEHEAKVYFVESIHEDGILLVNGIKDEFFTDLDDRSVGEESINYFYENFRLLAKKESLEAEKV